MRDTHNGAHGRAADGSKLLHALHNTCIPTSPRALSTRLAPAAGDWAIVDGVKLRQGRGVYDDGAKQRYEGEWQNDMMHGRGTFEYASGAKYEGEFVANKYDGYGSFIFSTGAKYEGQFKDNQFHGSGTFTDAQHVEWKGKFYNGTGTHARTSSRPAFVRHARRSRTHWLGADTALIAHASQVPASAVARWWRADRYLSRERAWARARSLDAVAWWRRASVHRVF